MFYLFGTFVRSQSSDIHCEVSSRICAPEIRNVLLDFLEVQQFLFLCQMFFDLTRVYIIEGDPSQDVFWLVFENNGRSCYFLHNPPVIIHKTTWRQSNDAILAYSSREKVLQSFRCLFPEGIDCQELVLQPFDRCPEKSLNFLVKIKKWIVQQNCQLGADSRCAYAVYPYEKDFHA